MFRNEAYWYEGVFDFLSVVAGIIGFVLGVILLAAAVGCGIFWIFDRPECLNRGPMMGADVSWSFSTGCMVKVTGQDVYLPWREIVPVERDGKIVYVPKPYNTVKFDK